MKLIFIILIVSFFASCMPKRALNEISVKNNGLRCDSTFLFYQDDKYPYLDVKMDSAIEMVFVGLQGFNVFEGNVFVGGSLVVKDSVGEIFFKIDDVFIFLDSTGVEKNLVNKRLGMVLEVGSPMKVGHTYYWENVIWDKKGNSRIIAKTKIVPR